jgi:hypothetical protein
VKTVYIDVGVQSTTHLGTYVEIVEAPSPQDVTRIIKLGVTHDTFKRNASHKLATTIAQYYGIVRDGLIVAEHAFRGLKRPLLHGDDPHADEPVYVYAWRPVHDYEWTGYRTGGKILASDPPADRVFVVLVRLTPEDQEGVSGAILRWNWVREDPELRHAPVDYKVRYEEKLWSRNI